jgi:LysM repeat protein
MLVSACRTVSNENQSGNEGQSGDAVYKSIYDKYRSGLILTGASTYTVKSGDTLANISRSLYQDGFFYPVIMLASSDIVLDPDKIEPGMQLTVPNLQVNLDNANARANIKKFLLEIADVEQDRNRAATAKGLRDKSDSL